jgi:hypothetical protein
LFDQSKVAWSTPRFKVVNSPSLAEQLEPIPFPFYLFHSLQEGLRRLVVRGSQFAFVAFRLPAITEAG